MKEQRTSSVPKRTSKNTLLFKKTPKDTNQDTRNTLERGRKEGRVDI